MCIRDSGSGSRRNPRQCGMAYATTHVRHFDEGKWRGHEDHPGTLAPFELQGDGGYLHTSGDTNQACGTDQIGKNDLAHKGCRWGGLRAWVSYWTLLNPRPRCQFSVSSLLCWRPQPRSFEPCCSAPKLPLALHLGNVERSLLRGVVTQSYLLILQG